MDCLQPGKGTDSDCISRGVEATTAAVDEPPLMPAGPTLSLP